MRTKDERADFMATANALVDDFLRSLNQPGRSLSDLEGDVALARLLVWTLAPDPEEGGVETESERVAYARKMMCTWAAMFWVEAASEIEEGGRGMSESSDGVNPINASEV